MSATWSENRDGAVLGINLRRLMAREGLTIEKVVEATELDERTLRGLVRGRTNPHARTLHKLASGLGVSVDELFHPPGRYAPRQFDRATNSLVEDVVSRHPDTFANWSEADFDELYSRFGTSGQLTDEGVLHSAHAMNAKRDIWRRVSVILESSEAELLAALIDVLYVRTTVKQSAATAGAAEKRYGSI